MMTVAKSPIKTAVRFYGDNYHLGAHIPVNTVLIDELTSKELDARDLKHAIDLWISYMPLGKPANWVVSSVMNLNPPDQIDQFNRLRISDYEYSKLI